MNPKIAIKIDTPALGDTLASIPTLRKMSQAYSNTPLTVFTSYPFLFDNHPLVKEALPLDHSTEGYKVYTTFSPLVGKNHNLKGESVEFRHSNYDIRQCINNIECIKYTDGILNENTVDNIIDIPKLFHIRTILKSCINNDLKEALILIRQLYDTGFSANDILLTFLIFIILRNFITK